MGLNEDVKGATENSFPSAIKNEDDLAHSLEASRIRASSIVRALAVHGVLALVAIPAVFILSIYPAAFNVLASLLLLAFFVLYAVCAYIFVPFSKRNSFDPLLGVVALLIPGVLLAAAMTPPFAFLVLESYAGEVFYTGLAWFLGMVGLLLNPLLGSSGGEFYLQAVYQGKLIIPQIVSNFFTATLPVVAMFAGLTIKRFYENRAILTKASLYRFVASVLFFIIVAIGGVINFYVAQGIEESAHTKWQREMDEKFPLSEPEIIPVFETNPAVMAAITGEFTSTRVYFWEPFSREFDRSDDSYDGSVFTFAPDGILKVAFADELDNPYWRSTFSAELATIEDIDDEFRAGLRYLEERVGYDLFKVSVIYADLEKIQPPTGEIIFVSIKSDDDVIIYRPDVSETYIAHRTR